MPPGPEQAEATPPPKPEPIPEPEPEPEIPPAPLASKPEVAITPEPETESTEKPSPEEPPPPKDVPPEEKPASAVTAQRKLTWQNSLILKLNESKQYPSLARRYRQEGVVYLRFTMDKDGNVLAKNIEQSAGYLRVRRSLKKQVAGFP